jgi:hypothetical protein
MLNIADFIFQNYLRILICIPLVKHEAVIINDHAKEMVSSHLPQPCQQ